LLEGSQAVAVRGRPGGAWAGGMVAACCRSPSPFLAPAATASRDSAGADFFRTTLPVRINGSAAHVGRRDGRVANLPEPGRQTW
jgi:hypothetical protein